MLLDAARQADASGSPTAGANPWELAAGDPSDAADAARRASTPAQLAAWTVVARVLLNLDETITKE